MKMVLFAGAKKSWNEDGQKEYLKRGPIYINPEKVAAVWDNTILIDGIEINVMESMELIYAKLTGKWSWARLETPEKEKAEMLEKPSINK